ncbi:Glutathione S-transferase [Globisporangium polare]
MLLGETLGGSDKLVPHSIDERRRPSVVPHLHAAQGVYTGSFHADVQLFDFVENVLLKRLALSIASPFPKLHGVVESGKTSPNIAAYLAMQQYHKN